MCHAVLRDAFSCYQAHNTVSLFTQLFPRVQSVADTRPPFSIRAASLTAQRSKVYEQMVYKNRQVRDINRVVRVAINIG